MKRISLLLILAVVLVFAVSGFKKSDLVAVDIRDCVLSNEEVNFHIFPGPLYRPHSVVLNVNVTDEFNNSAIGSRKVELLAVPADGILFRVPLSRQLKPGQKYNVAVDISSSLAPSSRSEWESVHVNNSFTGSFFDKNFKPIIEPAQLRNQINVVSIRKNIY